MTGLENLLHVVKGKSRPFLIQVEMLSGSQCRYWISYYNSGNPGAFDIVVLDNELFCFYLLMQSCVDFGVEELHMSYVWLP